MPSLHEFLDERELTHQVTHPSHTRRITSHRDPEGSPLRLLRHAPML